MRYTHDVGPEKKLCRLHANCIVAEALEAGRELTPAEAEYLAARLAVITAFDEACGPATRLYEAALSLASQLTGYPYGDEATMPQNEAAYREARAPAMTAYHHLIKPMVDACDKGLEEADAAYWRRVAEAGPSEAR